MFSIARLAAATNSACVLPPPATVLFFGNILAFSRVMAGSSALLYYTIFRKIGSKYVPVSIFKRTKFKHQRRKKRAAIYCF